MEKYFINAWKLLKALKNYCCKWILSSNLGSTYSLSDKDEINNISSEDRKKIAINRLNYYENIPDKPLAPLIIKNKYIPKKTNSQCDNADKHHLEIIQGWMS